MTLENDGAPEITDDLISVFERFRVFLSPVESRGGEKSRSGIFLVSPLNSRLEFVRNFFCYMLLLESLWLIGFSFELKSRDRSGCRVGYIFGKMSRGAFLFLFSEVMKFGRLSLSGISTGPGDLKRFNRLILVSTRLSGHHVSLGTKY